MESESQVEAVIRKLRSIAMGERFAAQTHARLMETRTGEAFWAVVRGVSEAMGLPGVCLMLEGRLYEFGRGGGEGEVLARPLPGGRLVVRLEPESRKAGLAMFWVVRRALREGGGRER